MAQTWTDIRRTISRDVRDVVFRRVGGEITIGGSTSINNFYSTALGKFTTVFGLPYAFAYCHYTTDGGAPIGQELEITNFLSNGTVGYAYVEPSPTAQWGAGDKVEIHELWSVAEKQNAVNKAVDDAWPAFYREVVDETIVMQKFKRQYDLSSLAIAPRHIMAAYIEPIFRVGIGKATGAGVATLIDTGVDYTQTLEVGKTYELALIYGKGSGQVRTISNYNTATRTFTVTPGWSTTPDTTTEYMVKNISDVYYNWLGPITRLRLNQPEIPTTAEILYVTYEVWGARLRLVYAANLAKMVSESSSLDDVSAGYVIPRAKYHLYLGRIGAGPQFEVKTAATLADSFDRESKDYRDRNRMKRLHGTVYTDQGYINWSDREMPFRR